jgi:hypothetical protein
MTKVADQTELKIRRYIDDLQRRLLEESLSFRELKGAVGPLIGHTHKERPLETSYLRLFDELNIKATRAHNEIRHFEDRWYIYGDNRQRHSDHEYLNNMPKKDTRDTTMYLYQLLEPGTYADIFRSLNTNLDSLAFKTELQLFESSSHHLYPYVQSKADYVHFLFKSNGKYHVAICELSYEEHFGEKVELLEIRDFFDPEVWKADRENCFAVLF